MISAFRKHRGDMRTAERTSLCSRADDDGLGAWRVAETIGQLSATRRELVAATAAVALVAERDVARRGEARRAARADARRAAVVHGAAAAAHVVDALRAVRDHRVALRHVARRERVVHDGLPVEGHVGVGRRQPALELRLGDDVRRGLVAVGGVTGNEVVDLEAERWSEVT